MTRERDLWGFLIESFTPEEIERLVKLDFPELQHAILGGHASSGDIAQRLIAEICRRGIVAELFVVLLRERPRSAHEVGRLRGRWSEAAVDDGAHAQGQPAPAGSCRRDLPRRPPEPRYPLLSEWDAYPGGRWLLTNRGQRVRRFGRAVIIVFFLLGLVTLILSILAGAACIEVSLAGRERTGWILVGYMAELPHGLWYLSGAPLFVFAFGVFVERATDYLRAANKTGRIVVVDPEWPGMSALQWYAAANRRVFRVLTCALFLLACAIVVVGESVSWNDRVFGWVQAPQAASLAGADLGALEAGGVTTLPIEAELCPLDRLECRVTAVVGGTRSTSQLAWFVPFVGLALTIQVLFVFVCLYAMAKITFFIAVHMLAITGTGRLRLRLDFYDSNRRMGLGRLDEPLFAALWLAVLGGFISCLVVLSNNEKGWRFFLSGPALVSTNISHGVGFAINLTLLLAVFGVPLWFFDHSCHRARVRERTRLDRRRLDAGPSERADIDEQLRRIEVQRARPHNWPILGLGWSLVVLSVFLPMLLWAGSAWRPVTVLRDVAARQLPRGVCHILGQLPRPSEHRRGVVGPGAVRE